MRRPLSDVAAVVRFARQPQWLGVEWSDGVPPTVYVTPTRDSLACALLDAAQVLRVLGFKGLGFIYRCYDFEPGRVSLGLVCAGGIKLKLSKVK